MGKQQFTIARIFGAYYELYSPNTAYVMAVLKGKLRLRSSDDRHPFVVGDVVWAEPGPGAEWVIFEKEERKNYLTRKSDRGDSHVLSSNLDQVAILASCKDPETKPGFIDRLLAAAYHTKIPPLVVFTKKDLVSEEDTNEREEYYGSLGYDVVSVSLLNRNAIEPLWEKLRGKRTFLCGNSGVGKSTLMNLLHNRTIQRTNTISGTTKKGKHTTTNSFALFLEEDTVLVDSPGVKEWGILHLSKEEICDSFPELRSCETTCSQSLCCHWEEGCPKLSYLDSEMEETRKKSLESMLESLNKPYRMTRRDHWSQAVTKRY